MPKLILALREIRETTYAADGTVEQETYEAHYLKADAGDPSLTAWVELERPSRDDTRTVTAQRDAIEAAARVAEGITSR